MDSSSGQSSRQDSTLVQKVKGLLMRAWRERWNEIQWGIHLKKLICTAPPGSDTKEIAGKFLMLLCST